MKSTGSCGTAFAQMWRRLCLLAIVVFYCCGSIPKIFAEDETSSWIDPDTDVAHHQVHVPQGPEDFYGSNKTKVYHLIFSDEFSNKTKRSFDSGFDRRWTALEHIDKSNLGQHYFSPQAVQTDKGNLIITTSKPKHGYRGAKYLSGSVQTWNKFCFTSGYIEVRAILPGKWGIPGTWPAMWLMGMS